MTDSGGLVSWQVSAQSSQAFLSLNCKTVRNRPEYEPLERGKMYLVNTSALSFEKNHRSASTLPVLPMWIGPLLQQKTTGRRTPPHQVVASRRYFFPWLSWLVRHIRIQQDSVSLLQCPHDRIWTRWLHRHTRKSSLGTNGGVWSDVGSEFSPYP